MKLVYLSGKYSDSKIEDKLHNIQTAREYAVKLWLKGYTVICPHMNTMLMEHNGISYDTFLKGDYKMIKACDEMFMLPNWKESKGAIKEYTYARKLKKKVTFL